VFCPAGAAERPPAPSARRWRMYHMGMRLLYETKTAGTLDMGSLTSKGGRPILRLLGPPFTAGSTAHYAIYTIPQPPLAAGEWEETNRAPQTRHECRA
jgi:hypothetical protein